MHMYPISIVIYAIAFAIQFYIILSNVLMYLRDLRNNVFAKPFRPLFILGFLMFFISLVIMIAIPFTFA